MDSLTFEFMEKTKNIAMPPFTVQSLYRCKSLLLLIWILISLFYTSFLFLESGIAFFLTGFALILGLCTSHRPLADRWEQIFSLEVVFCFLPFGTPLIVYVVCALATVCIVEFLFMRLKGYFFNASVLVLLLALLIFPSLFFLPVPQPFTFFSQDFMFFLHSSFSISTATPFYREILPFVFGIYPYNPAGVLGLVGLGFCFFSFVPKIVYRTSFLYILGICLFSCLAVLFIPMKQGDFWAHYIFFLRGIFTTSNIVFTALFVIPETLGNPTPSYRFSLFALLNAFFTVFTYYYFPHILFSSLMAFGIVFLFFYLMSMSISLPVQRGEE